MRSSASRRQLCSPRFARICLGEFLNSFVLAKLKIATGGRWLWTRTIGSTLVGEGADTVVFIIVAFGVTASSRHHRS